MVHALLGRLPHDVHRALRLHSSSTVPIKAQRTLVCTSHSYEYLGRADGHRLAYWIILALVSYAELLLFPGSVLGLIWWPRFKYVLCLFMQFTWKFKARWSESDNERKVLEQEFVHVLSPRLVQLAEWIREPYF